MRSLRLTSVLTAAVLVGGAAMVGSASAQGGGDRASAPVPMNVDVSARHHNESEESVAINPTNPSNIVTVTNVDTPRAGMFEGVSFDGGQTWHRSLIGDHDSLGAACCDPSLSFDRFGNLFLTYLYNVAQVVPIALSTDGGLHFDRIATITKPPAVHPATGTERRGPFRSVDQPTLVTGPDSVWVVFNTGRMVATGAAVTGLGHVGTFIRPEQVPGTNNCTYGDVAVGPSGQVMQVCTLGQSGQGDGKLFVNTDPDGLGPAGFGRRVSVTDTHVGGFDFIPPQPDRSVDAEPGLAWDRTGGPHNGRVYLTYTIEHPNESDDTNIEVRHSDDGGASWSTPVRVNDDHTTNSQFLPKIALDPTSGHVAVSWYDARNDLGTGGAGDTDGVPNDDARFWGAFSSDGEHFTRNIRISAGTSNAADARNGIDFGDYSGLAFFAGVAHPMWSDNSNSTGDNPDGTLHQLDIFTAAVPEPGS